MASKYTAFRAINAAITGTTGAKVASESRVERRKSKALAQLRDKSFVLGKGEAVKVHALNPARTIFALVAALDAGATNDEVDEAAPDLAKRFDWKPAAEAIRASTGASFRRVFGLLGLDCNPDVVAAGFAVVDRLDADPAVRTLPLTMAQRVADRHAETLAALDGDPAAAPAAHSEPADAPAAEPPPAITDAMTGAAHVPAAKKRSRSEAKARGNSGATKPAAAPSMDLDL